MKHLVILSVVVTLGSVLALPASHRVQSDDAVQEPLDEISRKYGQFILGLGYVSYYSPLWVVIKDLDDEELSSFVEELHSHRKPQNEEEQAEAVEDDPVEQEVDELSRHQYGEFVPGLGFVSYFSPMWDVIKDLSDEELDAFVKDLYGYPFAQDQDKKDKRYTTQRRDHLAEFGHVHHGSYYWSGVNFVETEEFRKFISHLHLLHHRPIHRPVHHHHQDVSQEAEEENDLSKYELANFKSSVEEIRSQNEDEPNSVEENTEADEEKRSQNDDENIYESSNEITEKERITQNEDQENNDVAEEEVEDKTEESSKEVEGEVYEESRVQSEDADNKDDADESRAQNEDEETVIEIDAGRAQNEDEENTDDEVEYKLE